MRSNARHPFRRLGAVLFAVWLTALLGAAGSRAEGPAPADPAPADNTAVAEGAEESPADQTPGGATGTAAAKAGLLQLPDNGNPYRAIVARNAFRLKDPLPPPPPPTNPPPPVEPPKIDVKLSGVAEIRGIRWAYFVIPDPKRQGQFLYPALTDDPTHGDVRKNGVEVKEIDTRKGSVRVINGGVEATLNFKEHGVKGAAPAPGGKPGAVPAPGAPGTPNFNGAKPATTVVVPAGGAAPTPGGGEASPVVFSRRGNRASNDAGGNANPAAGIGLPMTAVGVGSSAATANFPTRPVRSEVATPITTAPQIPIEHQYEILLKQRQAYDAVGVPLPPIPGLPAPTPTP